MAENISADEHIRLIRESGIHRFLEIIEFIPIGITISDNEGNLIESNHVGARLLGLKKEQHTYWTLDDPKWHVIRQDCSIVNPEDYPSMRALKERIRVENEVLGIVKQNEITWLNITATPLPGDEGVLVAYVDISENIKREKELEKLNYKLRNLVENRDKFYRILAHDLKNPFNSIFGFCELIRTNISDLSIEEIDNYIGIIQSTAGSTFELLENLLEWSRAQSGALEFKPCQNNISEVINEVITFCLSLANQKKLKIIFKNKCDCIAYFDRNMIHTVLRNLITNAIKYSYPDGIIEINTESYENYIKVSVKDSGTGIAKDNLNEIFLNHDRKSLPGTLNEKGSGLGLSICKEFIDLHHGIIRVESELGKGSEFSFNLPKDLIKKK